jgi:uncharacterized OsmC-like protein
MTSADDGYPAWQGAVRALRARVEGDPRQGARSTTVVAAWEGESRARVDFAEATFHLGGDGEPTSMEALLGALSACQIDVIATHAALLDISIESVSVEAEGRFDIASYLGIAGAAGPGFEHIDLRVGIRAPDMTTEQLAELRRRCEESSPVGDSLRRPVPVRIEVVQG